ncbi:MAG: hypothetical protein V1650_00815 [Candidatus Omnitrophota bacterium]
MSRKIIILTAAVLFIFSLTGKNSLAEPQSLAYLNESGVSFYNSGKYDAALGEFNKALLIDPANITAKEYVNKIFKEQFSSQDKSVKAPVVSEAKPSKVSKVSQPASRDSAMDQAMMQVYVKGDLERPCLEPGTLNDEKFDEKLEKEKRKAKYNLAGINITGDMQLALGQESSGNTVWKSANYDLNELNWRRLSSNALDNRFSTYDPRIYDSLDVNMDTDNEEGFNFHGNITVDPWSFTAKSASTTMSSPTSGDYAQVEIKYWSNTGYTVNENYPTQKFGNSFNLNEMYAQNNSIPPFQVNGVYTTNGISNDAFNMPQTTKLYRQFQPMRELWVDYNTEPVNFRFFPIGYQDQAFSSDDPLAITNHHIWWEDSMWLSNYAPGIYNSGLNPVDFTQGNWDDQLTFLSRDSVGTYLTALKGFAFDYQPQEGSYLKATVAAPQNLWQNYTDVDNLVSALRGRYLATDNFYAGATFTNRLGFNPNLDYKLDQQNYVSGLDFGYEVIDGVKASAEVLTSKTFHDQTSNAYNSKNRGNAYYFSLIARFPRVSVMDLKYGYDEIKMGKSDNSLTKAKFYLSSMDNGFESALSTYRNTRNDTFWSRHVTFRKPFDYYYSGLKYPGLKWDEIYATRIGDGIDTGRKVIGFRLETEIKNKFSNLFDVRNVHLANGKFLENVARDEISFKVNDKLTTKGLALYHKQHNTYGNVDPFIFNTQTGNYAYNDTVGDNLNPTTKTGSVGFEYELLKWLSVNGVYELTNDYNLAYDNFPRDVMQGFDMGSTFNLNGNQYRQENMYLYSQKWYPKPPYHFYNIFKSGIRLEPRDNLDIYLDYTRNNFESAGQISDLMNHIGLEMTYMPFEKFGTAFKYNYSRWKDPTAVVNGGNEMSLTGHHNFFGEFRYLPSKEDELILQYGEGNTSPIGNITFDPYGGGLTTIDTQHIIRGYYRRKF